MISVWLYSLISVVIVSFISLVGVLSFLAESGTSKKTARACHHPHHECLLRTTTKERNALKARSEREIVDGKCSMREELNIFHSSPVQDGLMYIRND